jgi:DNA-3-methyladenine glycosylase II
MAATAELSMSHPSTHEVRVDAPFRLDLTVSALRRTSTNLVDVYTEDERYLRALGGFANPVVVSVAQAASDRLVVTITGPAGGSTEVAGVLATVRRILGTEQDVSDFHRRAQAVPWLLPLAQRWRGLKPPSYPSLFEACANAILFQQVSLHAATAIMRRMLGSIGVRVEHEGVPLIVFPGVEQFLAADIAVIRRAGVSESKLGTLRRASEAIATSALSEAALRVLPSAEAALALRGIKGIGAWTAAVILLRGFGRLDVFPEGDSGVAANLARVAGERLNAEPIAKLLGSQRGMLYFCLLLARLEERRELGTPSDVARQTSEREGSALASR